MGKATSWSHLALNAVRWSARVLGALVATFFLYMFAAHAFEGEFSQGLSVADVVGLSGMLVMVSALLVGWFWEGVAATILLAGYAVMVLTSGRLITAPPFLVFPIVGLMFAFCFWRSRRSSRQDSDPDGRRLAIRAGALLGLMSITASVFVLTEPDESETAMMAAETELTGRWKSENSDTIKVLKQDGDSLSGSSTAGSGVESTYDLERREDGYYEGVVRYDSPCEYADTGTGETHTTTCYFEEKMTLWLETPNRIMGEGVHVFPLSADPADVRQYCQSGCTEGVEREVNFVWVRQE